MAWCNPPPFAEWVLREATLIAPGRRGDPRVTPGRENSDGICGDRAHQAEISDHNPDARGIPHAVDISHSVPGAPFWSSRYKAFDVMRQALLIAARRDPRVKYLVANFGGPDMIWEPDSGWTQNGSYKTDHRSHLHVSFTVAAENSTAPFFGPEEDDVTPQDKKDIIEGVLKVLRRQPDGSPGLIGDEVAHIFGGYPDGVHYEDGALLGPMRKEYKIAKQ